MIKDNKPNKVENSPILITAEELNQFLYKVLIKENVDEFSARSVSDGLIHASLRGVDSHGIRLFPHYLRAVQGGRINRNPRFKFNQSSASTATLDADNAFGHAAGMKAVEKVVKLTEKSGMGSVSVKNSSHFGAASFFGLEIARHNLIGFSFTHSDPLIPPTHAKKPYLGNNPICFTAPCDGEEPLCLDMATSMITFNKVLRLREDGQSAPPNSGFDENGDETTDPNQIVSLAPVGGHKGYGLSLMVDVLCALLSGMPFGPHVGHMYNDPMDHPRRLGQYFMAIKIDAFQDIGVFKKRMKQLALELRAQNPKESSNPVMVAGDPEKIEAGKRQKNGIPISRFEQSFLEKLSMEYKIELVVK